jgi:hypothetical protein
LDVSCLVVCFCTGFLPIETDTGFLPILVIFLTTGFLTTGFFVGILAGIFLTVTFLVSGSFVFE